MTCAEDQIFALTPSWIDRVQRARDIYGVDNRARGALYEFHQCRRPGPHELKPSDAAFVVATIKSWIW